MGIFKSIKNLFTSNKESRTVVSLNDPILTEFLRQEEIPETIFSVINRQANVFASLPLKMIDKDYKQPTNCSAFNLLLDGPRYFTKFDFFRDVETLRSFYGNAYVQLFRDLNGNVVDMAIVKPNACSPVMNIDDRELYYQITATDKGENKGNIYVHYKEILHFKHTRFSGAKGINPVDILKNTLEFDNEVRKISLKQLNGTNEGLKVRFESNMDDKLKTAAVKNIAEFYKKNGGLLIEENGVTIERLKRDLVDSKLLDTDKISRSRIAMVYNVPEHFVGNTNASYSSLEQLNLEYLTYNLLPVVNQYEEELNKKTLTKTDKLNGYRYKFNVAALLRADTATRGQFYQIMRRSSVMSGNDVRRLEDMTPINIPGMDDYHISGDMYPVDMDVSLRKTSRSVE